MGRSEPPANVPGFVPYGPALSPDTVQAGEPVSVSVRVRNVGVSAGTYDAELEVDGAPYAVTPVTLARGRVDHGDVDDHTRRCRNAPARHGTR
ncbi:hypothetical protein [Actinophytocola glycyrrhizae]|uniref:CARDB domain-containing protein n=1 Tax=Actinophytocola glycyrrhizae TaxID=2044873 RepID=A0ABV9RUB6_9PSEU